MTTDRVSSIAIINETGDEELKTIVIESEGFAQLMHEQGQCSMGCGYCYQEAVQSAGEGALDDFEDSSMMLDLYPDLHSDFEDIDCKDCGRKFFIDPQNYTPEANARRIADGMPVRSWPTICDACAKAIKMAEQEAA